MLGQAEQIVRRIAHCRDDDNNIVSAFFGLDDTFGDLLEFARVSDTAAAILLDDDGHGEEFRVSSFGFQVSSFVGTTPFHVSPVSFVDIMRSGVVGRMGHAPDLPLSNQLEA